MEPNGAQRGFGLKKAAHGPLFSRRSSKLPALKALQEFEVTRETALLGSPMIGQPGTF